MSTASISRWVAGLAYSDIPPEVLDRARGADAMGFTNALNAGLDVVAPLYAAKRTSA